jgi:hypothetical protein
MMAPPTASRLTQSTPTIAEAQTAHRADGKVDFAEHQDADDAERDDADGGAIEQQIDEIVRRRKTGLSMLKTVEMTMSPTATGSMPRSPERTRSMNLARSRITASCA